MLQLLDKRLDTDGGEIRWTSIGSGPSIVLVHGTPYSSLIWRAITPALSAHRRVFLFDHLGYGQSEQREGQDLGIAAQGRCIARLLGHWQLDAPSVVATDIGGAITLRALLLEGACFGDLLLADAVTGGEWERGLFALMLEHTDVVAALPGYAHRALVTSHMHNATHLGFRPGVLDDLLAPWIGAEGQAAYYRQYRQLRQADTAEYEHLLGEISEPVRILWGAMIRSCLPNTPSGSRHACLTRLCHGRTTPGTCSPKTPQRDSWPRFSRRRRFASRRPTGHQISQRRERPPA